jgi:hypothetical protein
VDLRADLVHTLHQFEPTHRLGGFPDLYTHSSREDSHWDSRVGGRIVGLGTSSATGSVRGVQQRLLGTRTEVPCRHDFDGLLFDQISK